jgi:hypothetical protein
MVCSLVVRKRRKLFLVCCLLARKSGERSERREGNIKKEKY